MKDKIILMVKILLVLSAVAVLIYNIYVGKQIAYLASGVAVVGTVVILAQDISKRNKF